MNWRDKTVTRIFEEQVVLYGNCTALVCDNETLTYNELNNKANILANLLAKEYKVKKGDIIALLPDKSSFCYISLIAILKCGAQYLPLSPDTPGERIRYIIDNSGAKLLLTICKYNNYLEKTNTKILNIDTLDLKSIDPAQNNLTIEISPKDGAYIIYTSGTTGKPNGVLIPHSGITRLVKGTDYFPFEEQNTFLQLSNIGFDAATFEIWGALLNGNKLIATNHHVTDLPVLETNILANDVTAIFLTSSFFNLLITERPQVLKSLKYLLVGGEAISVKHIEKARLTFPELQIINGYGPTECTTFACCYRIPNDFDFSKNSIPIGQAITDTQLYLFDKELRNVKLGDEGELYIAGSGLAISYLNNTELSKKRFVTHPTHNQIRLYKTGDICRYDIDGNLLYVGRTDNQLKIRGFRVETEEVEHKIGQHKAVNSCIVIGIKSDWSNKLVAFVTPRVVSEINSVCRIHTININLLKHELQEWLPPFMIPSIIIELNKLPINRNGKADKQKLIEIYQDSEKQQNEIEFESETEKTIYKIWTQHFNNREIGIDESFFDIGGDSLQAMSLANSINATLQINTSAIDIFKKLTIRKLAQYIIENPEDLSTFRTITKLKDGEGEPIYLASGLNGNELRFVDFVANFNKNNPIYCLNYPNHNSKELDNYTMESLATFFLNAILIQKPTDKIHLLGYSFGGRLVFEMAIQCQKRNINTGKLFIIDIVGPQHSYNNFTKKEKLRNEITVFKKLNFKLKSNYLKYRLPILFKPLVTVNQDNKTRIESKIFNEKELHIRAIFYRIFNNYKSNEQYPGKTILIRTSIKSLSPVDMVYYLYNISQFNYWEFNVKSKITLYEIDSGHIEILSNQNARLIAEYVAKELV